MWKNPLKLETDGMKGEGNQKELKIRGSVRLKKH